MRVREREAGADPLWSSKLRRRLLQVGQGTLNQAVPVSEMPQQRIPQGLLGQNTRVAKHHQPIPCPRQGNIHTSRIAQEANALHASQTYQGTVSGLQGTASWASSKAMVSRLTSYS